MSVHCPHPALGLRHTLYLSVWQHDGLGSGRGHVVAVTDTSSIAVGSLVVVRDEEWMVRAVQRTAADGLMVKVIGASEFVRDEEATFFTGIDKVVPLRPEDTHLVPDESPGYRRSRLWIEALLRKTLVALGETRLAVSHRLLMDPLDYQRRWPWRRCSRACSSPTRSAWAGRSKSE